MRAFFLTAVIAAFLQLAFARAEERIDITWRPVERPQMDILFDGAPLLSSSGVGLYLIPELENLFETRDVCVNKHWRFRAEGDR